MCFLSCISQKTSRIINYLLTIILALALTGLLVFVIIKSKYTSLKLEWNTVLITIICITSLVLALVIIGGLSFCWNNKFCYALFLILNIATTLVFLALGVICLVNSSTEALSKTIGCESSNENLRSNFAEYDKYIFEMDKILCSDECVCTIYQPENFTQVDLLRQSRGAYLVYPKSGNPEESPNTNAYSNYYFEEQPSSTSQDYSISFSLESWEYVQQPGHPTAFPNCTAQAQQTARTRFYSQQNSTLNFTEQTLIDFEGWYSLLETYFNCVGLCSSRYEISGFWRSVNKYLVSDVNRGPPLYYGCLRSVAEWAPQQLVVVGVVAFLLAVLGLIISWLSCGVVCAKENEKQRE